ncbi:hypothetical protein ACP4OV_015727 [Aristida adscensionis]
MALRRHVAPPAVLLLLLFATAGPSLAQQSNGTSHHSHTTGGFTTTTAVVLVVLISAFVLLTLFSVYINRCAQTRPPPPRRASRAAPHQSPAADGGDAAAARARGLDKETVESFPTAVYGDVKARVAARPGLLECAVCLAAFEDDDELRVLPACCHVFHPGCIDPWLAGAVTCPLCRADLSAPPSGESCEPTAMARQEPEEQEDDEACLVAAFTPESVVSFGATRPREFHYRRTQSAMEMPDRHTLMLPEHVMRELAAVRRHRRAASLAGYPDAVERTPRWLTSFWRSMSWRPQSRTEPDDAYAAAQEHGGGKRVVPITGVAPAERPSVSGSGGDKQKPDVDALDRV